MVALIAAVQIATGASVVVQSANAEAAAVRWPRALFLSRRRPLAAPNPFRARPSPKPARPSWNRPPHRVPVKVVHVPIATARPARAMSAPAVFAAAVSSFRECSEGVARHPRCVERRLPAVRTIVNQVRSRWSPFHRNRARPTGSGSTNQSRCCRGHSTDGPPSVVHTRGSRR